MVPRARSITFSRGCCMRTSALHSETCACGADLRQLPLAGIAPKRAHGPERVGGIDPGGLWGFLHICLDVWIDFGGRGRQFSACHYYRVLPPAIRFLLLVMEQAQSATDTARKPHPGLSGGARRRRESAPPPVASQSLQAH